MNEGRDVWAGGNLSEKNAAMKKTMNRGLLLHKGGELFHKKTPLTENEILEKELDGIQEYVTKERARRKAGLPFGHSPLVEKEGTSEGAKLGWESRRGGGAAEDKPKAESLREPTEAERSKITNWIGSTWSRQFGQVGRAGIKAAFTSEARFRIEGTKDPQALRNLADGLEDENHHDLADEARQRLAGMGYDAQGQPKKIKEKPEEPKKYVDPLYDPNASRQQIMDEVKNTRSRLTEMAHQKHTEDQKFKIKLAEDRLRALQAKIGKSASDDSFGLISKDEIEKIMKDGGWDKLPLTDRAREIVEDAISRGAKPATEYTGKLLVEHAIPEEPPAFTRPKNLKVGDTVIPLNWVGVCTQGAKFDLPSVPEAFKVKKMYTGPAKVTKNSYPYGRYPSDISKVETVMEDRLWGLELDDRLGKEDDGTSSMPISTRDTTLVLRLDPQATPSGEVNPGVSQRD